MSRNPDADRTLGAFFAASLDEAAREEEPIAFEQIAAYVDGQLDDVDREIFESRLALDPALRAEVADLTAMRAAMAQPARSQTASAAAAPTARAARGASSMLWVLGALAAAASLTIAVIWVARTRQDQSSAVSEQTSARQTPQPERQTPQSPQPQHLRIALQDAGGTIGLDASGTLAATAANLSEALSNADTARDTAAALQHGTLPPTALPRTLRSSGPLTLMGGGQTSRTTFGVTAPVATVVREARPTFRWQPLADARAYKVAIYTDHLERVAESGDLTATTTTWTPDLDLKPGVTYQWQVTALTSGTPMLTPAPPQPEARFRILDPDQRPALDRRLAEAGSSNLLRGLAFTRAGLLDDADAAFNALAAANPASPIARDLLANAQQLRTQNQN